MSEKDALAFISKLGDDAELQKKVNAGDPKAWDQVARAAGFDVTKAELDAVAVAIGKQLKNSNLSDEQLGQVTGGAGMVASPTYVQFQGTQFNATNLGKLASIKMPAW